MIEIEFNLYVAERMGKKNQTLDLEAPVSLPELEARLGLPGETVGMLLINGAWAPLDSVIKDGDFVQLYPFMEGG